MPYVLANRFIPTASPVVRSVLLALAGSLFVAGAAQITVPMYPVPMTLQTFAVLAVGAAFGSKLGAGTLVLYALEGAIGLPFFAGRKSGVFDQKLDYLFPSGSMGYVAGFILAAWLAGRIAETAPAKSIVRTVFATTVGAIALYVSGLIWLAIWVMKTQHMQLPEAVSATLSWGLYPFIIGDAIKALLAAFGVATASTIVSTTKV